MEVLRRLCEMTPVTKIASQDETAMINPYAKNFPNSISCFVGSKVADKWKLRWFQFPHGKGNNRERTNHHFKQTPFHVHFVSPFISLNS